MEHHSFSSSGPLVSPAPQPNKATFRRTSRSEGNGVCPIPGIPADILRMRVKEGSKIHNLLQFVSNRMQGRGGGDSTRTPVRQVVFTGSGRGITKTITCVEILKREVEGLHQLSKLHYKTINEIWESPQQEAAALTVETTVPAICILLSKDPLDPQEPGYQPPHTFSVPEDDGGGHRDLLRTADRSTSQHAAKRLCPNS
ncbi:ribonuclease P protein subunit p25-like protein [Nothobranchius furzeri]|uniref:Ribonuclease P and MRP subunit p25 n=3 Tax=Nothobranchius furzeri TaxID=105023 RepID=A0A8C6P5L2_NOTFU|nr:ribonuclease P protein subunit p25-like protein [Nothobranchius furzeri]